MSVARAEASTDATGDKQVPCAPCKARGESDSCAQVEKHDAAAAGCATLGDLERVLRRVADLEDMVSSLRSAQLPPMLRPPLREPLETTLPSIAHASIPPRPQPAAPPHPDEDAALMLEGLSLS